MQTSLIKVRLLADSVPFYTSEKDSTPAFSITGQPIAEIGAANVKGEKLPLRLADGRFGFVSPDVNCLKIPLWSIASSEAKVFQEASREASIIATLGYGAFLQQYGPSSSINGATWIPVMLNDGRLGYVDAHLEFVDHGSQVCIRKSERDPGRINLLNGGKLTPLEKLVPLDQRTEQRKDPAIVDAAYREITTGGAAFLGGVVLTLLTYFLATKFHGPYYIAFFGMMIGGAGRFILGLIKLLSDQTQN